MTKFKLGNTNGTIAGKVVFGGVQQKETKTGKQYEELTVGIQLPSGVTVFIANRVFETVRSNPTMSKKIAFVEDVISSYKDTDHYVSLRIKPNADGENKFANFSSYVNKDGKLSFRAEGFPEPVETEIDADGNVHMVFTNAKQETFKRAFKDFNTGMIFEMYVEKIDGTMVTLTDGKENFANKVTINVKEDIANQLVLGQLYTFVCEFEKGKKAEATSSETDAIESIFSFASDFKVESMRKGVSYASDKLTLVKGGIIKGYSIEVDSASTSSFGFSTPATAAKPSRVSMGSIDLPF